MAVNGVGPRYSLLDTAILSERNLAAKGGRTIGREAAERAANARSRKRLLRAMGYAPSTPTLAALGSDSFPPQGNVRHMPQRFPATTFTELKNKTERGAPWAGRRFCVTV